MLQVMGQITTFSTTFTSGRHQKLNILNFTEKPVEARGLLLQAIWRYTAPTAAEGGGGLKTVYE